MSSIKSEFPEDHICHRCGSNMSSYLAHTITVVEPPCREYYFVCDACNGRKLVVYRIMDNRRFALLNVCQDFEKEIVLQMPPNFRTIKKLGWEDNRLKVLDEPDPWEN